MDLMENIEKICESLVDESMKETENKFARLIEELKNNKLIDWTDPSVVDCMHLFEQRKVVHIILQEIYPNAGDNLWKISTIYNNYSYIGNQIRSMVDMGYGCIADKTRWIINEVIKYYNHEECSVLPERTSVDNKYWHPDFGDTDMWIKYVDILVRSVYSGMDKDCLNFISELLDKKENVKSDIDKETKIINDVYLDVLKAIPSLKEELNVDVPRSLVIDIVSEASRNIVSGKITKNKIIERIKEEITKGE